MSIALADLEKRRGTFFYRHAGPSGSEEMCCLSKGASSWKSAQLGHPASDSRTPQETSLKGWKPLMSIALADLERADTFFYRHAGPGGPEEMSLHFL